MSQILRATCEWALALSTSAIAEFALVPNTHRDGRYTGAVMSICFAFKGANPPGDTFAAGISMGAMYAVTLGLSEENSTFQSNIKKIALATFLGGLIGFGVEILRTTTEADHF